ncbi:DUF1295 domain-containing protein [archaeon]|nr:DUF1295 domain-containing protein [archaeon]
MKKFIKSPVSAFLLIGLNVIIITLGAEGFNLYGLPLIAAGGFIYFYNRRLMGDAWTVRVKEKDRLVTKGLFKYVRHPLYLGLLVLTVGLVISFVNKWLLLFLVFIDVPYLYDRALIEEELLLKCLKGYKDYLRRTERFLPKIRVIMD